jgi:uncharacterized protein
VGPSPIRSRDHQWTNLFVTSLTQWALIRPGRFLLIAALLTLLGSIYSATSLQFRTSRLDLLDTRSEYNQRWLKYLELFGKKDDGIILIEGESPERVRRSLLEIGRKLQADSRFSGVLYSSAVPELAASRLHFAPGDSIASLRQLLQLYTFAITPIPTVKSPASNTAPQLPRSVVEPVYRPGVSAIEQQWEQLLTFNALPMLGAEIESLQRFLANPSESPPLGMWQQLAEATHDHSPTVEQSLLLDDGGKLGLCLIPLHHPDDDARQSTAEIGALRDYIVSFQNDYPDLRFYLTGMPVLEADEGASTQSDMMIASVVSLVGVALMLIVAYGSLRLPILAMVALFFGLLWTVTFATIAIGHLNLLSAAFGAILIGLGIDFSIHYLSHFLTSTAEDKANRLTVHEHLMSTAEHCGLGIWIGAISTAAAFGCAAVTPFKGIAELGVISGGGTILCVIAALTVLPASLLIYFQLCNPREAKVSLAGSSTESRRSRLFANALSRFSSIAIRNPLVVISVSIAIVIVAAPVAYRCQFDHNLLHLQADGLDSVQAENVLIERSSHSTWYAISLADTPQAAQQIAERFRGLKSVARVDHAASLILSQGGSEQQAELKKLAQDAEVLLALQRGGSSATASMSGVENWLSKAVPRLQGTPLASQVALLAQQIGKTDEPERSRLLEQFEMIRQASAVEKLEQLQRLAIVPAPTIADLPIAIRERLWHPTGVYQIRIFPKGNVWDREPLERFVKDLERIDPRVTGHPVQTYYASGELQQSYLSASIYALLAVSLILTLNFKNPLLVLAAMLPAVCGLISLLALMNWSGMPLNPANMIALPLVLGIGVDDGVHLTEQFRNRMRDSANFGLTPTASVGNTVSLGRTRGRYAVSPGTALALLLTSLSTMIGFGSLMVADHQGLFSLGWVLTLGIGLCWVYSVVVLPAVFSAVIRWRIGYYSRRKRRSGRTKEPFAEPLDGEPTTPSIARDASSPRTTPRRRNGV